MRRYKHTRKIIGLNYLKALVWVGLSLPCFAAEQPESHKLFLEKTFQLARLARHKGNHPFGALLVYRGQIILTAENLVTSSHDVTAHAEMMLLRAASKKFPKKFSRTQFCTQAQSLVPCVLEPSIGQEYLAWFMGAPLKH